MKPRTVLYFFHQTFTSIVRNKLMAAASVATVAIALFVLGAFLLMVLNANSVAATLESNVEIAVFLEVDLPRTQAIALNNQINKLDGVAQTSLVPKEEGLAQLSREFGQQHDLLAALGGTNPLPDYLKVKAKGPEQVFPVTQAITAMEGVEKVQFGEEIVERLFNVLRWVRWIGLGSMVLLSLAAVFLVAITVRLTVVARRREIGIMKYVGATDWFIRWPFFLEGMLLGLAGSLAAVATLYAVYMVLMRTMSNAVTFIPLITDPGMVIGLLSWLLVAGTCVGAVGSAVSVHRFLRV